MPEDLHDILRRIAERLSKIEGALSERPCGDHKQWLADHEKRLRQVEMRIYTIWVGAIVAGVLIGYWL